MRHRLLVGLCFLVVSFADLSMAFSYNATSPPQSPLYGIDPPNGWVDFDFVPVPPAAGTVSIGIFACADLNENNETVHINVLGGKVFGNLFAGDSGTGCSGDCSATVNLTMTAAEWNAARSSSAGGIGGVEFEATPSSTVTNICCSDTCSSSGPAGSSECCANQCSPIPCFRGSITFSVSYVEAACTTNGDCGDGNACTTDVCSGGNCSNTNAPSGTACGDPTNDACKNPDTCNGAGSCVSNDEPNGASCSDGQFCDGAETCQSGICTAGADPCPVLTCDESTNSCICTTNGDCDDGLFCNGVEVCVQGACHTGGTCDDGRDCTVDSCNEATDTCTNTPNDAFCDDGVLCNGAEWCDVGFDCQPGAPETCDDGVGCTDDSCNLVTDSCENIPVDANCDDGLFCNGTESCDVDLDCLSGVPLNCDDGFACTDDSCNETTDSCDNIPNDANDCSDGVFCNGVEPCVAGVCQPGPGDSGLLIMFPTSEDAGHPS